MDFTFLFELEKKLHQPEIRSDVKALEALLHPDFFEIGVSGRHWNRSECISALLQESGEGVVSENYAWTKLRENLVRLTYISKSANQIAFRCSIWIQSGGNWQLRYHQGQMKK